MQLHEHISDCLMDLYATTYSKTDKEIIFYRIFNGFDQLSILSLKATDCFTLYAVNLLAMAGVSNVHFVPVSFMIWLKNMFLNLLEIIFF